MLVIQSPSNVFYDHTFDWQPVLFGDKVQRENSEEWLQANLFLVNITFSTFLFYGSTFISTEYLGHNPANTSYN